MIKLCVGAETVEDLSDWQAKRIAELKREKKPPNAFHDTRMSPKRAAEMLDGGSLYWVIKHFIIVRQRFVGFEEIRDRDGKPMCRIHLDPELVRTKPRKKRPFQGWRYLESAQAPPDLRDVSDADLPPELARELRALGAW